MVWVFLEIALVLGLAVAIVWWTLPKKPRADDRGAENGNPDER